MTFLLLLPTFLCALIMAAHFLRDFTFQAAAGAPWAARWDLFMVALSLLLPCLLMFRRFVVLRALQLMLVLGAIDLLFTGYDIVQQRLAQHNPDVLPPGIIMAANAAFFLLAAGLLQAARLKAHYPKDVDVSVQPPHPPAPSAASGGKETA